MAHYMDFSQGNMAQQPYPTFEPEYVTRATPQFADYPDEDEDGPSLLGSLLGGAAIGGLGGAAYGGYRGYADNDYRRGVMRDVARDQAQRRGMDPTRAKEHVENMPGTSPWADIGKGMIGKPALYGAGAGALAGVLRYLLSS